MNVLLVEKTGKFAENKDVAREIREKAILPAISEGKEITLDFHGVEATTQSFIHALISEPIRFYNGKALTRIIFKNCNENVKEIISIVVDYMQSAI